MQEGLPGLRLGRSHLGVLLQLDREESGVLCGPEQIAFVEVEQRVRRRLEICIDRVELCARSVRPSTGYPAPSQKRTFCSSRYAKRLKGLEQRETTAGTKNSEELS